MKRGFIFDFDGTLADTLTDLAAAVNRLLAREGFPEHSVDAYRMFVGNGILKMIERALPEGAKERAEELKTPFLRDYADHCLLRSALYPGIGELLAELLDRNVPLGILTNKSEPLAVKMARALVPESLLANLRGARPEIPLKPDPSAALALASDLGLSPEEVIFVGDSRMDMETAVAAGMTPCGVRWGFRSEEELLKAGAAHLISHPRELLGLVDP